MSNRFEEKLANIMAAAEATGKILTRKQAVQIENRSFQLQKETKYDARRMAKIKQFQIDKSWALFKSNNQ